jgi:membrane protease YdiL (CAAX protease family)
MPSVDILARSPLLVLVWSFGLFMFMHLHQYVGALLAAWRSKQTFDAIMSGKFQDHTTALLRGLAAAGVGIPLAWIATSFLWRRPVEWMQLDFRGGMLLAGLGLGIALPVLVALVLRAVGLASITRQRAGGHRKEKTVALLGIACTAAFTGIAEEIVFRAMAAREIALLWGWPLAVLVSGAFFGLVHLVSRLKTLTVRTGLTILIASIAVSFLFIAMYVRSGSLWLPIGFHAAWNFSLVGVLGLPMGGETTKAGLLQSKLDDSSWLTGGPVGLEVSPVALAVYVVVGLLFVLL